MAAKCTATGVSPPASGSSSDKASAPVYGSLDICYNYGKSVGTVYVGDLAPPADSLVVEAMASASSEPTKTGGAQTTHMTNVTAAAATYTFAVVSPSPPLMSAQKIVR